MSEHFRKLYKTTKFDVSYQEKEAYNKTYNTELSYGYYSAFKEGGMLHSEWYEHLHNPAQSHDEFVKDAVEYEEYRRRFHVKMDFNTYRERRDSGTLKQEKWYLYLIDFYNRIPADFTAAFAEYMEYRQEYNEDISFFEYYDMKDNGELPHEEWYHKLIELEEGITELLETPIF